MSSGRKIYTKTGDAGFTSLIGGTRVPKYDTRIEAYGTMDELNSFVGLLRDQDIDEHSKEVLLEVQDRLFTLESTLAADSERHLKSLPNIKPEDIQLLEKEIDNMNETLPELTSFVLPGGHPTVSYCHIARTICRRAERITIKLNESYSLPPVIITYLNRLSDYLFVLARKFSQDFGAKESLWKPRF
ncbi:MAG: cob(I)yrinic acid a,c-diamide adenosyltransferase [Bacteroidales bacterium]|nr:cob(I)yrinic acid a,c-diamide adenosyltransferase [Bacteroidales bacterium]